MNAPRPRPTRLTPAEATYQLRQRGDRLSRACADLIETIMRNLTLSEEAAAVALQRLAESSADCAYCDLPHSQINECPNGEYCRRRVDLGGWTFGE